MNSNMHRFNNQRGMTLIEVIAALAVLSTVLALAARMSDEFMTDTKAMVTAQHTKAVAEAAKGYIQDNHAALAAVATPTTPATVTVAMLVSTGYLSSGFNQVNNRKQTACVQILEPTAGRLDALVVTTGGDTIDDLTLGQIAAAMGAGGGAVYDADAANAKGAMGGWTLPIANYAAATCPNGQAVTKGHNVVALWFDKNTLTTSFLYRDAVPGRPELNRMNTALDMGGNTITALPSITAAQLADSPVGTGNCTTNGDLGRGPNGEVVSCVSNKWKASGSAYWGDPQSVGTNTPTQAQLDTALGVCTASAPPKGRVHMVYGASGQPRPYVCDGTDWQPVAVDLAGNITVPGLLKANMLQPTLTATEGTSDANCVVADNTTWGRTAKDANGLLLSCQSGVWKKAQGSSGSIGGFGFKINGYTTKFYGVGNYNSSTGTFSGDLICDPVTVGASCGSNGRYWCGSSGSCAWDYAGYDGYYYTVGVSALPINTVVSIW